MNEDSELDLAELLAEVRRIDVQSKRLVTDLLAGGYTSVFRGAGLEFDGVREYAEGDDPRLVDWNVTARVGRPFVKKYVDERELSVVFLLDLSASMLGGYAALSARQTAARVCACLALSAVRSNDKVGLVAFSEEVERYLPPRKGAGHALRIVRDCLALPGACPRTDLRPALRFASRVVRRRSILFLISDFLTGGWREDAALCARRHDLIAVRLLTPELEPPGREAGRPGLARLRDPETGRTAVVDLSSSRLRAVQARRLAAWGDRTVQDLHRAGVDRIDVPLVRQRDRDMVARPLVAFFRMRQRRGAKR